VLKSAASLVAVVVSLAASAALACGGHSSGQTAQAGAPATAVVASQTEKTAAPTKSDTATPTPAKTFKTVSVDDVQKGLDGLKKDKKAYAVFDANGKATRESQGIIPTAVLLPSSSAYDLALLPADKATPTVFYCANERCTASHSAAKRALDAGFTDVSVLSAGISGWVKAGKATEKPPVG